jgi:hypothetical protein
MTTLTQRMNVVEETLQSIRLTLDTLLQNLLNPALMVPGTLRFGGNKMQLDNKGIQVQSDGTDLTAIYGVEKLVADPSAEADLSTVRFNVTGGGDIETSIEASANNQATTSLWTLHAGNDGRKWALTESPILLASGITPTTIGSDQNDYDPTSLANAQVLRLASDASRTITGLAGGLGGRFLFIINIGANDIILSNENASSDAAHRFAIGADVTLGASESCILWYDNTSTRWRMVGRHN